MPDVDLNELERYLRIYQENPDSRVFAPLADMYRRLARFREAEQICREGLQRHPYYAGGKVALAYILFDTNRLSEAYQEIDAVVTYYPDNLMARKILIRVLVGMGQKEKAQREYGALLQLAPQLAGDPELEQTLKSDIAPVSFENIKKQNQIEASANPRQVLERTELEIVPTGANKKVSSKRSRQLVLLRKKRILENWLQTLESN